jgi:hypothetical protein
VATRLSLLTAVPEVFSGVAMFALLESPPALPEVAARLTLIAVPVVIQELKCLQG